jgi:hypothetical protein
MDGTDCPRRSQMKLGYTIVYVRDVPASLAYYAGALRAAR